MKFTLLLLSHADSAHTIKWATSFAKRGTYVIIFSLGDSKTKIYQKYNNIKVISGKHRISRNEGAISKLKYLKNLSLLKETIKRFSPQIIHSHYASSYGLLGVLTNYHPVLTSVWGADVFSFPKKSLLHNFVLRYVLNKSDRVFSTSHVMAAETNKYLSSTIQVIPFGVDTNIFKPYKVQSLFHPEDIVIGTVKTLEEKYGVEYLIRAFHKVLCWHPNLPLKLLVVGGGSLELHLKNICKKLGLSSHVVFTGLVPYEKVSMYQNMLSISVTVSILNSESFGVAVLEASACQKPVIVSNVGGLPEVVKNGVTGIIIPPRDVLATAFAIERVVLNNDLRLKMGYAGRQFVIKYYQWEDSVTQMIDIYNQLLYR
jgi:L-malate glycosyltransferase